MKKTLRTGVLVDWSQSNGTRPPSRRTRCAVSGPSGTAHLEGAVILELAQFEYDEVARVAKRGDAGGDRRRRRPGSQAGTPGARATAAVASGSDRLSEYRAKNATARLPSLFRTPSYAASTVAASSSRSTTLAACNADLRLERDGVLVSWAVPEGVPADPRRRGPPARVRHLRGHDSEWRVREGTMPDPWDWQLRTREAARRRGDRDPDGVGRRRLRADRADQDEFRPERRGRWRREVELAATA